LADEQAPLYRESSTDLLRFSCCVYLADINRPQREALVSARELCGARSDTIMLHKAVEGPELRLSSSIIIMGSPHLGDCEGVRGVAVSTDHVPSTQPDYVKPRTTEPRPSRLEQRTRTL